MKDFNIISWLNKIKKFIIYKKKKWIKKHTICRFQKKLSQFLKINSEIDEKSKLILVWEMGGFPFILCKNSIFSLALNLRGFKTKFVICDGLPLACMQRGLECNEKFCEWPHKCVDCKNSMKHMADKYGLTYVFSSSLIDEDNKEKFYNLAHTFDIGKIRGYKFLGVDVGELAWSSTNRYFKGFLVYPENMDIEESFIYRKYFYAALVSTYISDAIIIRDKPIAILTSHGVYVDYAPPFVMAGKIGLSSLCWSSGFNYYFHYFTIPKDFKNSFKNLKESLPKDNLSDQQNARLDKFLVGRYFKKEARDMDIFSAPQNIKILKQEIGLKNLNPVVILFAHVNWDYCFDLSSMIFKSPNDWVVESLKKMISITDVNWIIRVHPGEKIDGSLFGTGDLIKKEFNILPDHIKILWSDSKINTYGLFQLIDCAITVFGTVGVEVPLFGKPIIVAGDAHFAKKGFTIDPDSKEEYFKLLENVKNIKPLSQDQINLARRYAYSYFIERQIPLTVINKAQGHWGDIDLNKLDRLLPGNDPIIDKICDGIISGKDVILDEECFKYLEKIKEL